jgi:hypothetical protein
MTNTIRIVLVAMALWAACPTPPIADAAMEPTALHADWGKEFLAAVKETIRRSPAWDQARARVQRYVHDIEYDVEQMVAQATKDDPGGVKEHGQLLKALLHRGRAKGYLSPDDVESLIQRMDQYLAAS